MTIETVVLGCGVGGACAALALTIVGARVRVYEVTPRHADVDGWVTIGPAAMTALDALGVGEDVRRLGFPVTAIVSVDTRTGVINSFERREPGHRWPSTHVWRRDLLAVLRHRLDAAGVMCDYRITVDPREISSDLIVGADGARSATRAFLGDARQPLYAGELIRYGHHPQHLSALAPSVLHFWTDAGGVVGYVGDERDGSFWFSRRSVASPDTVTERETFLTPLRATPVAELLDRSRLGDTIAIYELEPEGVWHSSNTVLIGDAAHALSPAAGRGASSAIEDAVILAKAVCGSGSVAAGLIEYTRLRRPAARAAYQRIPGQRAAPVTAAELRF